PRRPRRRHPPRARTPSPRRSRREAAPAPPERSRLPRHDRRQRRARWRSLTFRVPYALQRMMDDVAVPPYERFYLEHRDAVFAFLARRLGREAAEDAFQETFLRALRGYRSLRHGGELRAWVFTIAARVVVDEHRRRPRQTPTDRIDAGAAEDGRPAYAE